MVQRRGVVQRRESKPYTSKQLKAEKVLPPLQLLEREEKKTAVRKIQKMPAVRKKRELRK